MMMMVSGLEGDLDSIIFQGQLALGARWVRSRPSSHGSTLQAKNELWTKRRECRLSLPADIRPIDIRL